MRTEEEAQNIRQDYRLLHKVMEQVLAEAKEERKNRTLGTLVKKKLMKKQWSTVNSTTNPD